MKLESINLIINYYLYQSIPKTVYISYIYYSPQVLQFVESDFAYYPDPLIL